MSDFEEEYRKKGVEFLAINAFEEEAAGRAFIAEAGLDYHWAFADSDTLRALGVEMIPAQIIVDREGRVAWVSSMTSISRGVDAIRDALDRALG